jgi:hypothetical protein
MTFSNSILAEYLLANQIAYRKALLEVFEKSVGSNILFIFFMIQFFESNHRPYLPQFGYLFSFLKMTKVIFTDDLRQKAYGLNG